MLFNSYEFIFVFLPVAVAAYYLLGRWDARWAAGWLVLCSVGFYAWWNPSFVILLLGSIVFNYSVGTGIMASGPDRPARQSMLLVGGIAANLSLLFYYKYLFALLGFFGILQGTSWGGSMILPLGISFFTFTQIGYLVDCRQGGVTERGPLDYALFVTFFPHLIAGPILHNREMMPQFADPRTYRFKLENITVGLSIFTIGLCKKVLIADQLAPAADWGFADPAGLSLYGAWLAALSYSLQLYFDFSGYSDMAIGLARMFGLRFPLNFDSPYKAHSIIDFWQRWHMTLTRYLTLYLYNPVALRAARRQAKKDGGLAHPAGQKVRAFLGVVIVPTLFTMTLAGIWHGAGLQFLIFGLLHAMYLSINHAWRMFGPRRKKGASASRIGVLGGMAVTYIAVLVGQIFFRAASVGDAVAMIGGMSGLHPISGKIIIPPQFGGHFGGLIQRLASQGFVAMGSTAADFKAWGWIAVGFTIAWGLPNTQQIMAEYSPALGKVKPGSIRALTWRPGARWGFLTGMLLLTGVFNLANVTRFLYFQF
jgi:D-alanyl-lipoteichoic acid acyltransferase DltB (MBOAT superfamily)